MLSNVYKIQQCIARSFTKKAIKYVIGLIVLGTILGNYKCYLENTAGTKLWGQYPQSASTCWITLYSISHIEYVKISAMKIREFSIILQNGSIGNF